MPRVKLPDGRVVAFPDGMTQDQMGEALQKLPPVQMPASTPPAPTAPFSSPFMPSTPKSPLTPARDPRAEQVAQRLQSGGFGPPAALAAPGAGPISSAIGQGIAGAGEALASGKGPMEALKQGGLGAVGGAAGGILGKGIQALPKLSGGMFRAGEKAASTLADTLKNEAPMLGKFPSNVRGLKQMLLGQRGSDAMHAAYDASLKNIVKKAGDKTITIPADAARELGLKTNVTPVTPAASGRSFEIPMVTVPASQAAEAVIGNSGTKAYRAVTNALDAANLGDPAIRKAYKTWSGMREYFGQPGTFTPKGFDLYKAQQGLNALKPSGILTKRGLGDTVEQALGPAITKNSLKGPGAVAGAAIEGAGGALGGHALGGNPLIGALLGGGFGAKMGSVLGNKVPTYSGLPPSAVQNFLARLAPRAGGVIGSMVST